MPASGVKTRKVISGIAANGLPKPGTGCADSARRTDVIHGNHPSLSTREREIAMLLSQGYKKRQIAEILSLKKGTVKHHMCDIYEKLGVFDRLELSLYVSRHGL